MGYIDSNLRPNETIILVGKVHAIYSAMLYAALLFLVLLVAIGASADAPALIWFAVPFMVWVGYGILFNMTTEIVLTDQRFVYKTGVVARDVFELQRGQIESVRLTQTVAERLIGAGTLVASGTGGHTKPVVHLAAPGKLRDAIYALISSPK